MPTEIDELMDLDPTGLTANDPRLEEIIAYHRKNRANAEAGIKPPKSSGPKVKLDLEAMGLVKPKAAVAPIKRRF